VATVVERGVGQMRGPIVRVCGRDTPIPMAPALERVVLPTPARIEAGIRAALAGGS
jgi:pyruvate/2-oxoglutarate/acetoin dehydrogenase E1 component